MTTLVHEATDAIERLDFRPACACNSAVCGRHGVGAECGTEAVAILTLHLVNSCTRDTATPEGNHVAPVCQACLDDLSAGATIFLNRVAALAKSIGGRPVCSTCGCFLTQLSDIVRDVRSIR